MRFDYFRNRRGNIAVITALTILPVIGILGGGIDLMRATSLSSQLQASIDSAALAAANLNNDGDVKSVVEEYVASNLSGDKAFLGTVETTITETRALNAKEVTISAGGHIDTFFLGLFQIETLPVTASATATQSITNVEIALVLDISSSMKGNRIKSLKNAAATFIEEMLDEDSANVTSISLIPFGGTVNIGDDLFTDYAVSAGAAMEDPTELQYALAKSVLSGRFRFSDGDQCIEYKPEDFGDALMPFRSRSQVPHFWRWNNFNPWCPLASSAMLMNSNDPEALTKHIGGMTLSDGTGMDIGAMWGLKALSPKWRGEFGGDFLNRPAAYDAQTLKALVVMTDGGITQQDRPKDYAVYNTHANRPNNEPATGAGRGDQGDNKNKQVVVPKGGGRTTAEEDKAVGYFKRVCDDAQAAGAVVYAIGFQIKSGSLPDSMLKYCASDSSKYYHVESLDIQSAFDAIAASVNALRITG